MFIKIILVMLLIAVATSVASAQISLVPLYRLHNDTTNNDLLTADQTEHSSLVSSGWSEIGVVGYVYPSNSVAGLAPLYRLHNLSTTGTGSGDRVYTTTTAERDLYLSKGYTLEAIACYVFPANASSVCKPLYRSVNDTTGQHQYTGGQIEYSGLSYGWHGEGAIAYIYASSSTVIPTMSAAQVIQIAATFCQSINVPVTATGVAQYPVPREDNDSDNGVIPELLWPMRWQVKFGDQATVEVVDGSGIVSSFTNTAYFMRPKLQQPAGTLLSQAAATPFAILALQASGQTDALGPVQGELVQYNSPQPYVGDCRWKINWDRQLNGITYHDDGIRATVDAESGEIESFSIGYHASPPTNTSVSISSAQAQSAAQAQLASSGIQNATMSSIQTQIVQPTSFWQDGNELPASNAGKVAWVYAFAEPNDRMGEVWVDAQTGTVIGGTEYGMRGGVQRAAATKKVLS